MSMLLEGRTCGRKGDGQRARLEPCGRQAKRQRVRCNSRSSRGSKIKHRCCFEGRTCRRKEIDIGENLSIHVHEEREKEKTRDGLYAISNTCTEIGVGSRRVKKSIIII